jgi:hypothetical protein
LFLSFCFSLLNWLLHVLQQTAGGFSPFCPHSRAMHTCANVRARAICEMWSTFEFTRAFPFMVGHVRLPDDHISCLTV